MKDRNGSNADHFNLLQAKHSVTYHRLLSHCVKLWEFHEYLCRYIFVQDTINDGWYRCKKEIEKNQDPVVSHWCAWKSTEKLVPKQEVHVGLKSQRWHNEILAIDKCFKNERKTGRCWGLVKVIYGNISESDKTCWNSHGATILVSVY